MAIIALAPYMLLIILVLQGQISALAAIAGAGFITVISLIFIYPYIANLSALTAYVRQLAQDDRSAKAPDLSFLNNVEELSAAVEELHQSWEVRRRDLESSITESRLLIDTLPDIILMLDQHHNIVRTNQTARQHFTPHLYRTNLEEVVSSPPLKEAIAKVGLTGHGVTVPYTMDTQPQRFFMIAIEPFPQRASSNYRYIIAMHDITEQKRTETMLSDFVANASHEIRTPLTTMLGFVETLQTTAKNDKDALNEFLPLMRQQGERMAKLVRDLLSLSKLERNLSNPPTERCSLTSLLANAIEHLSPSAEERQITLNNKLPSRLPRIIGDHEELIQVFENLLSNAIKYSPKQTEITISSSILPANDKEDGESVRINITDEGDGIPEAVIPRLTERFYRVDTARSRKMGGTGLGLSIVKYILDRHNGRLKIKSTEGKGSTFSVILPLPGNKS